MVPQHLRQSHTPDQLHSDKGLAAIEVDLVNRNDVGMIQGACGSGFAEEALTAGWIRSARIMEKLQRNRPIQERVMRLPDNSITTATDFPGELIV